MQESKQIYDAHTHTTPIELKWSRGKFKENERKSHEILIDYFARQFMKLTDIK